MKGSPIAKEIMDDLKRQKKYQQKIEMTKKFEERRRENGRREKRQGETEKV